MTRDVGDTLERHRITILLSLAVLAALATAYLSLPDTYKPGSILFNDSGVQPSGSEGQTDVPPATGEKPLDELTPEELQAKLDEARKGIKFWQGEVAEDKKYGIDPGNSQSELDQHEQEYKELLAEERRRQSAKAW